MNAATKLSAYGVALALLAGTGWVAGRAIGPLGAPSAAPASGSAHGGGPAEAHGGNDIAADMAQQPGGLASAGGGYTFAPAGTTLTAGADRQFTFRILGRNGQPVTAFDVEHEKLMHLIVVRRDTAAFQHVHPRLRRDGTWTVPLSLARPGSYRAYADFTPAGGEAQTLGVDIAVPGDFQPTTHPPSRVSTVDGYRVRLDGDLVPGRSSTVTLNVLKNGRPVTDLQPYLGSYGHLVALRGGDLAYLHVHPHGEPGDGRTPAGPAVTFAAQVPSAGTYRLFFDFQHAGAVRTAEFTVTTTGHAVPGAPAPPTDDGHGH